MDNINNSAPIDEGLTRFQQDLADMEAAASMVGVRKVLSGMFARIIPNERLNRRQKKLKRKQREEVRLGTKG